MAAETQTLRDTEKKLIMKFFSDASESDVKKIDVSTLAWAKHTLTLSGAASPNFKIGEVLTTGGSETFIVTGFTAGASTVEVVGWDNTNKKATAIDTGMSNGDAVVGGVTGTNTRTVANSGNFTELDYNLLVTKILWICNGLQVGIEWDGSTAEKYIAELAGNGTWSMPGNEFPGIPVNATGDSGNVLGDIQFSTADHSGTNSYTIIMECKKQAPGYDIPAYEQNNILGYPVDYVLGNFT
ncbi:MAG: hypothetical protein MK200_06500 [Nitrosopumilus sp.]|jgi:hypothetical protein|nr:hypothetical protein [Nitrosopumilus sp.]